ncbi:SigE family RNA polymerase sigma factor [Ornithinimicrobium sp. Y1694]|uniref:SigE family RNA polymerase sigma factor n=1 Tax=Ornithinimicrobium sp. Y1694 TaxID=3418590 RepID=UPI003CF5E75E
MRAEHEAEFVDFLDAASPRLLTSAWMLTGDPGSAEKLVQEALERVYVRWTRLRGGHPTAYARRVMSNLHTDTWRKRRREVLTEAPPEQFGGSEPSSSTVDLIRALQQLPTRERECVVLRHYLDLSEKDAADALGVSVGTVKSSTSRGLAGPRALLLEEETHV